MHDYDVDTFTADTTKRTFYFKPEVCEGEVEFDFQYNGNGSKLNIRCSGSQFDEHTEFKAHRDNQGIVRGVEIEFTGSLEAYAFLTACKKLADILEDDKMRETFIG